MLLNNGYPLDIIFKTINNRIKFHINKDKEKNKSHNTVENEKGFFSVSYVRGVSERFQEKFNDFRIAYAYHNKLNRIIKTGKDRLQPMEVSNVVYKISCKECNATYVGQTKRQLGTRIKEHKTDIKKTEWQPLGYLLAQIRIQS